MSSAVCYRTRDHTFRILITEDAGGDTSATTIMIYDNSYDPVADCELDSQFSIHCRTRVSTPIAERERDYFCNQNQLLALTSDLQLASFVRHWPKN